MIETGARPQQGFIEICNPADGTVVGTVPDESAELVAAKVRELRLFQPEWEAIGPAGRRDWLLRLQDWVLDNGRHIVGVLQSETGKSYSDACLEPPCLADVLSYWARHARAFLAERHPRPHNPILMTKKLTTRYRPYPVVGVIAPWNLPLLIPGADVVPALAAGAAVMLKPSEATPLSAMELLRGWTEIGAPPVFAVCTGGRETGAAVVADVDFVQFTGSTVTGRRVAVQCAQRLIPYSLELGGKDAAVVLADADLDRAVNGIVWGGMFNSGQACVAVERVYVEAAVYDAFLAKLTAKVGELEQGRGRRRPGRIGAMATAEQRDLVARHVAEAVAAGARVLTGGGPTGVGTSFQPTVLADVTQSMACMSEETFGPVLPVMKVTDEDEAIRLVNDSRYGLSATVWTADKRRGERVARRLEVGAVNVNDVMANLFNHATPMGGWKQSGVGSRSGGAAGILKYCRQQAITSPRIPVPATEPHWYAAPAPVNRIVSGLIRATAARGIRRLGFTPRMN